jgi:hypothetical protein
MNSAAIRASLSTLERDLESALEAKNQVEAGISGSRYKGPTYEEPEEALRYYLDHLHDLLLVILEVSDLSPTRERLMEQWKWFQENGGIGKTRFDPQFDYLESKPYDYLKTIIDGLRISTGENLSTGESYEVARLETILRKTPVLLRNRRVVPQRELDIQEVMNDYLSALFTEYKKSIQIGGIIRDFKPDCGIRNLKAAIEFKYAAKEEEVARAISGIFEDVSGYSGSRDWNRFYTVIYQTEPFESEDRVRTELTRAGAITWNLFLVTGSGSRRFKKRKSKTKRDTRAKKK